ncbi:hypothetical protein KKF82_08265 [Patescibacteria group bacterium]|nr:hypothetical protein [Patescibacteria group bacterium]
MLKYLLEILGDAIILTFGVLSILLFVGIVTQGAIMLVEPNRDILILELVLACLVIPFGIYHLINDLKSGIK